MRDSACASVSLNQWPVQRCRDHSPPGDDGGLVHPIISERRPWRDANTPVTPLRMGENGAAGIYA